MATFTGDPPASPMARIVRRLPEGLRGMGREHADRMLANVLLDPNAVGSAEPPSVLRSVIPAAATTAAVEQ
jgi:hypothetical protein